MASHSVLAVCLTACLGVVMAYDPNHPYRSDMPECKPYNCKAGLRPVQKAESDFKPFAVSHCMDRRQKMGNDFEYPEAIASCCYMKDICLASCGIEMKFCHKQFWKCVEWSCDSAVSNIKGTGSGADRQSNRNLCMEVGQKNDVRQVWLQRKEDLSAVGVSYSEKDTCKRFQSVQKEACDCIPSGEYDKLVKKRVEDFFRIHAPEMLNKKGEFKDKKLWGKHKGKRPEMFFNLMNAWNSSVEIHTWEYWKRKDGTHNDGWKESEQARDLDAHQRSEKETRAKAEAAQKSAEDAGWDDDDDDILPPKGTAKGTGEEL